MRNLIWLDNNLFGYCYSDQEKKTLLAFYETEDQPTNKQQEVKATRKV